ncbi:MAG: tRNA (adenosine(37)-N6)-threonylcarbamoyltransferase complex ATPase subunit type 1 TsaE [Actinomycetota bacterium]|nr:tRNA (adenosine(37)-N6)-threonylcarbamoyltransferase complex ATPase subunit type 1 TsaE [Actinomycetota bacterium]
MGERDYIHRVLTTRSEEETRELGEALASLLLPGDVILLVGELGTGKTCMARGLAQGLGVEERVLSPTFTLLREYRGDLPLVHLDAYRLEGPWDLHELGVEEYLEGEGVLMVEWGDRARDFFKQDLLEVKLEFAGWEGEREILLVPRGESWIGRLKDWSNSGNWHAGW